MELSVAIQLIQRGINSTTSSAWADLGAGSGLFTHALGNLLAKGSIIYAVDSNKSSLEKIKAIDGIEIIKVHENFERLPKISTPRLYRNGTFERARNLHITPFDAAQSWSKNVDGILMANSLHFVRDKISFINNASTWLKQDGSFVIVEYNMDKPNQWVPYPLSFESAKKLFSSLGYEVQLIGEERSKYNREGIYAASIAKPNSIS